MGLCGSTSSFQSKLPRTWKLFLLSFQTWKNWNFKYSKSCMKLQKMAFFFTYSSVGRRWPSSTSKVLPHMLAPLTRSAAVLMPTCCVLCLAAPRIGHLQGCPSILEGELLLLHAPLGQRPRNRWWENDDEEKMASDKDKSFQVMLRSIS